MSNPVSDRFGEMGSGARERAGEGLKAARARVEEQAEHLRDGYSRMQDNMSTASDDLSDFVRENPGRAVLITAAAGFLIGLLFRGK